MQTSALSAVTQPNTPKSHFQDILEVMVMERNNPIIGFFSPVQLGFHVDESHPDDTIGAS
tara:strand:+ start:278 stop:457 length:180 start_codon:yes stop_codon:yes gene_type:complete